MRLRTPSFTLAGWVIGRNSYTFKELQKKASIIVIVPVMAYKRKYVLGYLSNGKVPFNAGEQLDDYKFDDPHLWNFGTAIGENGKIYRDLNEDNVVFAPEGLEWCGTTKDKIILNRFLDKGAPFATFVGTAIL